MDLTDKQWEILAPLLPEPPRREDGRGRPWADSRKLLNGMLWVLRTGAQWQDLPGRYGTKSTCHRRFQQWVDSGVFEQILKTLALHMPAGRILQQLIQWSSGALLPQEGARDLADPAHRIMPGPNDLSPVVDRVGAASRVLERQIPELSVLPEERMEEPSLRPL